MAGGLAQRLDMGEKACILIKEIPLISYIISSLKKSKYIDKIYVSTTNNTPSTKLLIESLYPSISIIENSSCSYVKDMIYSVKKSGSKKPIMITMCDLPLIKEDIIDNIIETYYK